MADKIKLGVSACLLGQRVRYDGGHQLDRFIRDTLGRWVEFVPVCPEVECGLPVPRESMRLVGQVENPRLVTLKSGRDMTDRMQTWAAGKLDELEAEDLCGFIFKAKSPSSGMERIRVYNSDGMPQHEGRRRLCPDVHRPFSATAGGGRRAASRPQAPGNVHRAHFRL